MPTPVVRESRTTKVSAYYPYYNAAALGRAVIAFPIFVLVIFGLGGILMAATLFLQVVGGLPLNRVVLLDKVPDLGILVAALLALVRHPLVAWRKILRHSAGCTQGESSGMPLCPADSKKKAVNRLVVLNVNGAEHVIRLRGHDAGNPLLLYAHGGPGASEMLRGGADGGVREQHLEQSFVVVDYDQRGALTSAALNQKKGGGFDSSFLETLTVEQHAADCTAIATWLATVPDLLEARKRKFTSEPTFINKVHLTGGSWGSVVALNTVARAPTGLFASPVIVRGLVTDQVPSEKLGYNHIKKQMQECGAPKSDLEMLEQCRGVPQGSFQYIGEEGVQQMLKQRGFLGAYGGSSWKVLERIRATGSPGPRWKIFFDKGWEMMLTPEVPLSAALTAKKNLVATIVAMSPVLWRANVWVQPRHVANLDVLVAQGQFDKCTATDFVEDFLRKDLTVDKGRVKQLALFERSGHAPCKEEPAEFAALVRQAWGVAHPPGTPSGLPSYPVKTI